MDFYLNKIFRQSLVVHKAAYEVVKDRDINPSDFAKFNAVARFYKQDGVWLNRNDQKMSESSSWLCDILNQIYPQSTNLMQIFAFIEES